MLEVRGVTSYDEAQADYAEYFNDVDAELKEEGSRLQRQTVDTHAISSNLMYKGKRGMFQKMKNGVSKTLASVQEASISSVTKSATSIWRSVLSTASHVFGVSVPLSDVSEEVLSELSEDASSPYDDHDPHHAEILQELWLCLFEGNRFERKSPVWKSIGFQNEVASYYLCYATNIIIYCYDTNEY
jgi:hypothetical protein